MNALERLFGLEHHGIKLGLQNIQVLLEALGNPQKHWPAIHIAGTNGKGSVAAMVERALRAAGHHTGRYTSPHLSRIEERVAVDGAPVDAATFVRIAGHVLAVVDQLVADGGLAATPTFFEVTTAIAFEAFREAEITAGVIEVGLGGRFDATNVLQPKVCAITSIAIDHERYLGHTIAAIAFEKAGIIKPRVPVVVGPLAPEAHAVIERVARDHDAAVIDGSATPVTSVITRGRATISLRTDRHAYDAVRLRLLGAHQIANAVTAIRVLEAAAARGIAVDQAAIVAGVEQVEWPARLEWLALPAPSERARVEGPAPTLRHAQGRPEHSRGASERARVEGSERERVEGLRDADRECLLFDAAHNPAGAQALASYLEDAGVAPVPMVLAVMRDKDVASIVRALAPVASCWVATEAGTARSLTCAELARTIASVLSGAVVEQQPRMEDAVMAALRHAPTAVVAGSIFLVGPLRERLLARGFTPHAEAP